MNPKGQPQVMVVDDDPSTCTYLASFLSDRGYRFVSVSNARDAVRRYEAERPAAVILDMRQVRRQALTRRRRLQDDLGAFMHHAVGGPDPQLPQLTNRLVHAAPQLAVGQRIAVG